MTTQHLNTDLEIESADDLTPIVEEFGDDVVCLFHGRVRGYDRASFEIAGQSANASECVETFCALVGGLSEEARAVWNACSRRTFDIGFEAGSDRSNIQQTLRRESLAQVVSVGADIVVTVYPPRDEE